ncbi:HD domain-containing protein [bacterium]|nr:HD domain-containing protein [bacterium]
MKVDKNGGINLPDDNFPNRRKKAQTEGPKVQHTEANTQDAMNAQGRAFVNMSFKGNQSIQVTEDTRTPQEIYEEELRTLNEKLKKMPDEVQKQVKEWGGIIDINNISLVNKLLSDERLYKNTNLMERTQYILPTIDNESQANTKVRIIDAILSDERMANNKPLMNNLENIIAYTSTNSDYNFYTSLLDKVFSNDILSKNDNFIDSLLKYNYTHGLSLLNQTPHSPKLTLKTIDTILSNEKLRNNKDFINNRFVYLIKDINSPAQFSLLEKVCTDEKLSCLVDNITDIVSSFSIIPTKIDECFKLRSDYIEKICSNKNLYTNTNYMQNATKLISLIKDKKSYEAINCITDKIFENKNLLDDNHFIETLLCCDITSDTYNIEDLLKLLNDETITPIQAIILHEVNISDSNLSDDPLYRKVSYNNFRKINDIFGIENVKEFQANMIFTLASAIDNIPNDKKINELSATERRNLIKAIITSPHFNFTDCTSIKSHIPLLPSTEEEYAAFIQSLGIKTTTLNEKVINSFNKNINALSEGLKTMDDSEFNGLTINQEYDKDSFINDVLDKVKDLTTEEKEAVLNNFGFSLIENDRTKTGYSIKGYPQNFFNSADNFDSGNKNKNNSFKTIIDSEEETNEVNPIDSNNNAFQGKIIKTQKDDRANRQIKLNMIYDNPQIKNLKTLNAINEIKELVSRYSENNHITCENKEIESALNNILNILPELRPSIGKVQAGNIDENGNTVGKGSHNFDIFKHSLKVMQKITQNPEFNKLNESDKRIMLIASLLHDITKPEGYTDSKHSDESSIDAYFIAKKLKLSKEEEIKLYTLIKNHEWLGYVNRAKSTEDLTQRLQSVAYDLRHDNMVDMSLIFTHADLKAVKKDNSFHDKTDGAGRKDFNGDIRSFGESADFYAKKIKQLTEELKKSQPFLPVTPIPPASTIEKAITTVNSDGSTNLKGVYKDKDGLIVLKYNELNNEDLEKIGFPKGAITNGIKSQTDNGDNVNTGNIKFFVHGLDEPDQLAKFNAFSLPDSDALLSVSYAERPESKFRFFRPQGIILDCDTKYIHGGGNTDSGSGCGKDIQEFKNNYIFGGVRENDRNYIANLIKSATGMNDEEYINFVKENENKPLSAIQPEEQRNKIINAFATINSNTRKGERNYNEMYISNSKPPMAVFAYNMNTDEDIKNPITFLNRTTITKSEETYRGNGTSVSERTKFLREYALNNNLPFIVFGD